MAKCNYCGADTQLYSGSAPICLFCAVDREPQRKPPRFEHMAGRKDGAMQTHGRGHSEDRSLTCSECAGREAERLESIKRYVDL